MIELAMIMIIIAMLAGFGIISWGNMAEQRDASMVQSAQASLQSIVSQGAARMDVSPQDLRDKYSQQILLAIQAAVSDNQNSNSRVLFSSSGSNFTMTIQSSGRQASFAISNNGDVNLTQLSKFTVYKVNNGVIEKI